jgi:hypothetical protein
VKLDGLARTGTAHILSNRACEVCWISMGGMLKAAPHDIDEQEHAPALPIQAVVYCQTAD